MGYRYRKFFPYLDPNPLKEMDGVWTSCEHGVLKPEPEAYQSMLDTFGLHPEECLFIDDSAANVEQGIRMGMKGIVYHGDPTRLKNELERMLGLAH